MYILRNVQHYIGKYVLKYTLNYTQKETHMNKEKIAQKVREENDQYAALLQEYMDMGMTKLEAIDCITKEEIELHSKIIDAVVAVCVAVIVVLWVSFK